MRPKNDINEIIIVNSLSYNILKRLYCVVNLMPKIVVLPKNIADLIAAGEVVDRPASIVKEAVENSIDAGASFITVEIKNGGISYIRVTDNGSGIEREDLRNAFVSHATSKVRTTNDLDSIMTLGFRGEALASISAVAKIEVMTRTQDSELGTRYIIEGSDEKLLEEVGCPTGTTIIIRDLFFNTPARMKFLKKDVTEANAVSAVVDRLALSHPEISFRFIRDGKETLLTHGDSKMISAIYSVFSKDFASGLVPVDYELNGVKITGYISKPLHSRPNRSMQFFFVNNRFVKTKTAFIALEEAYKNQIMVGKFPSCVLNIQIPYNTVDVNVHPSKLEVRFSNEKLIFNAVYYGCLNSLKDNDTTPVVELDRIASKPDFTAPVAPEYEQTVMSDKTVKNFDIARNDAVFHVTRTADPRENDPNFIKMSSPSLPITEQYYKNDNILAGMKKTDDIDIKLSPEPSEAEDAAKASTKTILDEAVEDDVEVGRDTIEEKILQSVKIIGEAFKTYIFAEVNGKLYIVDKHAAHERILFEKIRSKADLSERQVLLAPVPVTLPKEEFDAVMGNLDVLLKSGFLVEQFGVGTVIVRESPLCIVRDDISYLISEIAGYLVDNKNDVITEKIDWIFHSSACRAAIKAGNITSVYEMEKLVEQILDNDDIRYCPHGRPVMVELTKREIDKFFGRIV